MTPPLSFSLFGSDGTPGIVKRVLGPSADSIGETLKRWVEKRTENVGRVLENAASKLDSGPDERGAVPLRVAARLLEEGSYCDDDIMVEYLGGVLASARTTVGRDDRGARWVALVTSMSSYAIRLHYVAYTAAQICLRTHPVVVEWGNESDYQQLTFVVAANELTVSMEFDESEDPEDIVPETMFELAREGMITNWTYCPPKDFERRYNRTSPPGGAFTFHPTSVGIQLLAWAHGKGSQWRSWIEIGHLVAESGISMPTANLLGLLPACAPST